MVRTQKKILEKGLYPYEYEVYEDGSAYAKCVSCGNFYDISPEIYLKLSESNSDWYKEFVCTKCWKKNKDEKRTDEIAWGQAFNNAVAYVLSAHPGYTLSWEDFFKKVREAQNVFYQYIKSNLNK
jgi:hypothetical protein